MILKNLLRRKGRTLLTMFGISIGVAAIIALGALAEGMEAGYGAVINGSGADLVLSDAEAFDLTLSAVGEEIGDALREMPEIAEVSPLLQGIVLTDDSPYFFVFGYEEDSFSLERFNIVEGVSLYSHEAQQMRGKSLLLGSAAAEVNNKVVGDSIRVGDSVFRIVGIYETGDAFEESGAVVSIADAQALMGLPHQVSVFYIKLKDTAQVDHLRGRIERLYPDLSLSTSEELADKNQMATSMRAMMWGVAAIAIVIGGVTMMNTQLMSVHERTREIGVLRAVGWRGWRIMRMILGESLIVGILGGLLGVGLAWGVLYLFTYVVGLGGMGATTEIHANLLVQSFIVVGILGLVGGGYPAYRAARLEPIEALRYEGGSGGANGSRLPIGGLPAQNLWRRKLRTLLTFAAIAITVGSVMALNAMMAGTTDMMGSVAGGSEIMVRQRDAADTGYAFIDERIGDRIAAMPEVENVSGMLVTFYMGEDVGMFIMQGYAPREAAVQNFHVVEGQRISTNRQVMIGRNYAEGHNLEVGDFMTLGEMRFKIVGIFEADTAWMEMGGVITLRDAQTFAGRQRKVTFFMIDLHNPTDAEAVIEQINAEHPEAWAALSGDFAAELPDMQAGNAMTGGIAFMAILVGGVGVMNTMLMSVLERTREIGVLRALGWRRRAILSLIFREALTLGVFGAVVGIFIAFGLGSLLKMIPDYGDILPFKWTVEVFVQSITIALALGLIGGLYPALRATRLQPVEALRYE